MILQRIDHVALNVKDLQHSFEWYNKVFGLEILHKWTHTWMVGNDSVRIGIFERPNASAISNIDSNIYAIQHFAFLTDKRAFEDAIKELDGMGIQHEPIEDSGIAYSVFVTDPDGHQVEITTYYIQ